MDPDYYRTGGLPTSLNRYPADITSLLAEQSQTVVPGTYHKYKVERSNLVSFLDNYVTIYTFIMRNLTSLTLILNFILSTFY